MPHSQSVIGSVASEDKENQGNPVDAHTMQTTAKQFHIKGQVVRRHLRGLTAVELKHMPLGLCYELGLLKSPIKVFSEVHNSFSMHVVIKATILRLSRGYQQSMSSQEHLLHIVHVLCRLYI